MTSKVINDNGWTKAGAHPGATGAVRGDILDPRWVARLLRLGFVLATVISQLAFVGEVYAYRDTAFLGLHFAGEAVAYGLFMLAMSVLAIAISFTSLFERYWRAITLDFCLFLLLGWTHVTALNHQQVQFFVVALVLLMATCAFVPWEFGWQAALSVACVILAGENTLLMRPAPPFVGTMWLELLAAAAVTLAGNQLWAKWRAALAETNSRLRGEIAERERAQKKLEESEAKLRRIFDASPDIICINSIVDGRYIDVNPQFFTTGYSKFEALGGSFESLGIWADREQLARFMRELCANGVVHSTEAEFRLKDGTTRSCLVSGALVELGGERCAVTFTSDITRLKLTERELIATREAALAASRAKSEFLSSMSHEIRTPMNSILGMADLLGETTLTGEQRRYVDTMTSNGNALLDLINSILDLAKVESGKLHLEETEFDLCELVERSVETLAVRAHEKGLELAARIAPETPFKVVGDPLRLRQVIINLVANAIKFTERGEVVLTVDNEPRAEGMGDDERLLRFSVRDTGVGIPREKLSTIFQSFTQVDSSVTRRYGGSGLGLAIARRLVDLMGGTIWVKSEMGFGSTFSFAARFRVVAGAGAETAEPDLTGLRVLAIADNATSRAVIDETLSARGAIVGQAASSKKAMARSARAQLAGEPYELALVDLTLPDGDGLEIARRLRSEGDRAPAVIMMLTSDNLSAKVSRIREHGFKDYLLKPLKRAELTQAAAAVTGRTVANRRPEVQETNAVERPDRALRILLVEDSRDNRSLIEAYLQKLPYQLDEAENGQVATEKFAQRRYDLVLMDMHMPVMDGYTATRRIRQWEREKKRTPTPIVALTASALEEDVRNTREAGCTTHLSKPIKKSRLLEAIRELAGTAACDAAPAASSQSGPQATAV